MLNPVTVSMGAKDKRETYKASAIHVAFYCNRFTPYLY